MTTPPPHDGDQPDGWGTPAPAPRPAQPYRPSPFPAYGPVPSFPPPPMAPPRKSHVGLIAVVTALIVLAIAGVTALLLATRPTVLDPSSVERDVAAQFQDRHGVAVELNCPDGMAVASGEEYSCTGTTSDREEITVWIQIADSLDGAYTWGEP